MSKLSEAVETTDNELLMQFVRRRDDTAFRQLVERHASLVMGVCRQISRNEQDAEDAFQATLLILKGETRAEAADYLETTESAVKAALARARRQLRMRLLKRGFVMSATLIATRDSFAATCPAPWSL